MNIEDITDEELTNELTFWEEYNRQLEAVRFYKGTDSVVHVEEARRTHEIRERQDESISTALPRLTRLTGGFKAGELVVVSGPTGMGKTTLLGSFTSDFSDKGIQSIWFSYEVGVLDLVKRFGGRIPSFYLPQKMVLENVGWLEQRIWEGITKFRTKVVFVDHLHYLVSMGDLAKAKSSSLVLGFVMRRLKDMALRTRTTIFLVSHMTKAKIDEAPTVNDLRDSSFVGQESDMVLFIWRKPFDQDPARDKAVIAIEKNRRTGTLGRVNVVLKEGRFYELADGR